MPPSFSIRELSEAESRKFLAAQQVGRLAYTFQGRVDIVPVHYVLEGEWLYGRTSLGPKLESLRHHHWVAFEVDDVRGPLDWTSVVVRGTFHFLDEVGNEQQRDRHERALAAVRRLQPWALTGEDLMPARTILFGVHVDEATGREGSTVAR